MNFSAKLNSIVLLCRIVSIQIMTVRCKKCSFTTADSNQELDHVIVESIRQLNASPRVKKIAILLYERTHLKSNEFKLLFESLMDSMVYSGEKFAIADCMEIIK